MVGKEIIQKEKKHWKGVYFTYCPNAKCPGTHEETNPPATPHGACLKCHKYLYSNFKTFPNEFAFNAWLINELEHPHIEQEPYIELHDNTHVHETNNGHQPLYEVTPSPTKDSTTPRKSTTPSSTKEDSTTPRKSATPSPTAGQHFHHVRKPHVDIPMLHTDVDTLQDRSDRSVPHVPHMNSFPAPSPSSRGQSPSNLSQLGERKRIILKVEGERYGEDFIAGSIDEIQSWANERAHQRHLKKWVLLRNGRSRLMSFDSIQPDDEYVLVAQG